MQTFSVLKLKILKITHFVQNVHFELQVTDVLFRVITNLLLSLFVTLPVYLIIYCLFLVRRYELLSVVLHEVDGVSHSFPKSNTSSFTIMQSKKIITFRKLESATVQHFKNDLTDLLITKMF